MLNKCYILPPNAKYNIIIRNYKKTNNHNLQYKSDTSNITASNIITTKYMHYNTEPQDCSKLFVLISVTRMQQRLVKQKKKLRHS